MRCIKISTPLSSFLMPSSISLFEVVILRCVLTRWWCNSFKSHSAWYDWLSSYWLFCGNVQAGK